MEPTKEYYKAVIDVIKYISEGNSYVTLEDGERLAGNYWPSVRDAFSEVKAVVELSNGDISVTQGHLLNPLYNDSEAAIERLEKMGPTVNLTTDTRKKTSSMVARGTAYPSWQ